MLFSALGRVKALPLILFIFLVSLFVLVSLYLETQERQRMASKARVVAQQVSNSIEVFSADRLRALEDLMITWPENYPNVTDWFHARAQTTRHVLPGFDDILWLDDNLNIAWSSKYQGADAPTQRALPALTKVRQEAPSPRVFSSYLYHASDDSYYALILRPINPYDLEHGYIMASFDIEATLAVMIGELVGSDFNFQLFDGEQLLMVNGELKSSETLISQPLSFAGREWLLRLQSNRGTLHIGYVVLGIGLFMSLIISIFIQRQLRSALKLNQSQQRYKAASEASLDAILIFNAVHRNGHISDFKLAEANHMAHSIFVTDGQVLKGRLLSKLLLELQAHPLLKVCKRVCVSGRAYEQYLASHSDLVRAQWLKIQIVKAGDGIAVTVRDITARRRSEQALKDSEEKFRRLVEGLNGHFIYSHDPDGNVSFVSHSVEDILGYSAEYFRRHYRQCVKQPPDNEKQIRHQLANGQRPAPYVVDYYTANGEVRQIEYRDSPVFDQQGQLIAIEGIGRDVTADLALQQQVQYQANHDQLTGLYNRYAFDRQLNNILRKVKQGRTQATLCYIDMDQFKLVNDSCGHQAGDELLRQVANLLSGHIDDHDVLARVGGDEFCLVFSRLSVADVKPRLVEMLQAIRSFRFSWDEKLFHIGASIGVVEISAEMANSVELIKAADHACYSAKNMGRNRYHVFDASDQQLNYQQNELEWVHAIQEALQHDRFVLYCQPIVPFNQAPEGCHYEILLRMQDEQGEMLNPGIFIPIAERYGLMNKIDEWVFAHTIALLAAHPAHLDVLGKCAINLSGMTLGNDEFLDNIVNQLRYTDIPPEKICFEITETAAVTNLGSASRFIDTLRDMGCRFALDDFGAGMSSFTYLKNMAVDYVKIDGSFVRNMCRDRSDYATVKAIHEIASSMGKQTIAEFVSDKESCRALTALGIDYGQGFALGKPVPLTTVLTAEAPCSAVAG
ncbi:EAL domain-containing protein [Lacimicrobium sp. SS2-24]|uniref:bifunctional diguanylate cyclase/phosphodiesterase n=1 Tax=Lacimicrobium sp. SS2-24 TaxID=2005569 RepID=UPI000B4AA1C7|nr:EAL domain-containing protein [Lacimicrobium sp. SS2-24]